MLAWVRHKTAVSINTILVFYTGSVCNNMTCSGNGQCEDGRCICNRLYSGEFCQNKGVYAMETLMSHFVC